MSTFEDMLQLIFRQSADLVRVTQKAKELLEENEQLKAKLAEAEKRNGPLQ